MIVMVSWMNIVEGVLDRQSQIYIHLINSLEGI